MVVAAKTNPLRKYKELEEMTGINATSWRDVCLERKRATAEHLEAIGRLWPEYSLWLLTGRTQSESGQTSPELEQLKLLQENLGKRSAD
ncbi:hypothetical protein Dsui_2103 [Azospira oryzae PS]|uniref:DNA-binding protein n=2 Tax=Rhodocyclaceae TaxID=75787 RepID=G8QJ56_AZOOP|nr:hypothetical protein Dsui_2103 [Azospira oryzae PS]